VARTPDEFMPGRPRSRRIASSFFLHGAERLHARPGPLFLLESSSRVPIVHFPRFLLSLSRLFWRSRGELSPYAI
jgi:hypothetical protein